MQTYTAMHCRCTGFQYLNQKLSIFIQNYSQLQTSVFLIKKCEIIIKTSYPLSPNSQIRCLSIQFNKDNKMISQNIFLEVQRWNRYAHPLEQLRDLKISGTPQRIKNYFINKNLSGSTLRHISSAQLQKSQASLKCSKVKQIYKERIKKWTRVKRFQDDNGSLEVKSISKTQDDQDQEISQYLNCWQQEEQLLVKK